MIVLASAAHGNNMLVRGGACDPARLREGTGADFAGGDAEAAILRFSDGPDDEPSDFVDWVERRRQAGAEGFLAADEKTAGLAPPSPKLAGETVPDRVIHAFAGSPGLLLGVIFEDRVDLHVPRIRFPRRYVVPARELLAEVESDPDRTALVERLVWENEHNLKLTRDPAWPALAAAVDETNAGEVLDALMRGLGNAKVPERARRRWSELLERFRNPERRPLIEVRGIREVRRWTVEVDVASRSATLGKALSAIRAFAADQGYSNWVRVFAEAERFLDADPPDRGIVRALGGTGLKPAALRLLASAVVADVFGGMGSWNDLPADPPHYREVSDGLFRQISSSLQVAVNSFWAR